MSSHSVETPVQSGPSSGPVSILRDGVGLIVKTPASFLFFILAGGLEFFSSWLGSLLTIVLTVALTALLFKKAGGRNAAGGSFLFRTVIAVVASLFAAIAVLVGLFLLVLPGIYLLIRFRLVIPAVVLGGAGPFEALSDSVRITEGHTWTIIGVMLIFLAVQVAVSAALAVHFGVFGPGGVDLSAARVTVRTAAVVNTALVTPISIAADVVMYGVYERSTYVGRGGTSSTSSRPAAA